MYIFFGGYILNFFICNYSVFINERILQQKNKLNSISAYKKNVLTTFLSCKSQCINTTATTIKSSTPYENSYSIYPFFKSHKVKCQIKLSHSRYISMTQSTFHSYYSTIPTLSCILKMHAYVNKHIKHLITCP
jgi:hypothetical protein